MARHRSRGFPSLFSTWLHPSYPLSSICRPGSRERNPKLHFLSNSPLFSFVERWLRGSLAMARWRMGSAGGPPSRWKAASSTKPVTLRRRTSARCPDGA
jgi:hypothetical protein